MKMPMVVIGEREDNFDKLPKILDKLNIKDEKLRKEVTEYLENHRNRNEIIDILEKLCEVPGTKITHDNLYRIYCINRDLIQLDSPIWSDPHDYVDDSFPKKTEKVSIHYLANEYYRLKEMKGHPTSVEVTLPFKKHRESLLRYLMDNHVIYSFDIGDIYDCPAKKHEEYSDILPENHEIEVTRIL